MNADPVFQNSRRVFAADEIKFLDYANTAGMFARIKEPNRLCYSAGFKTHDLAIVAFPGGSSHEPAGGYRMVIANPNIYYFSSALRLHRRILHKRDGLPELL